MQCLPIDSDQIQWGTGSEAGTVSWVRHGKLTDAVAYANDNDGTYIQLKTDVDTTAALEFAAGKTTTLDLNGCTIDLGLSASTLTPGGNVILVRGSLTLTDSRSAGKITGGSNSSSNNGGINGYGGGVSVVGSNSSFTMKGGSISGNHAFSGGGVSVIDGSFTMNSGTIENNGAERGFGGGGVFLNNGTFTMNGGHITGNNVSAAPGSSTSGGGVFLFNGTFNISGAASVTGNFKNGTLNDTSGLYEIGSGSKNNVCLGQGQNQKITVAGPLTGSIGVNTKTTPTEGTPVDITGNNSADYSSYFSSDSDDYIIQNSSAQVVQLAVNAATRPPMPPR